MMRWITLNYEINAMDTGMYYVYNNIIHGPESAPFGGVWFGWRSMAVKCLSFMLFKCSMA